MKHLFIIKKRDLAIGNFFTQISSTFNKVLFSFFAALFSYAGWTTMPNSLDTFEIGFIIFSFFFYLIVILLFVFFFGVLLAFFTPIFKKGVLGKHNFEFLEEEFLESTEYNESRYKYKGITSVFSRFGTIYIALGGMQWYIFPKRDFKSKEDRLALLKLLHERSKA